MGAGGRDGEVRPQPGVGGRGREVFGGLELQHGPVRRRRRRSACWAASERLLEPPPGGAGPAPVGAGAAERGGASPACMGVEPDWHRRGGDRSSTSCSSARRRVTPEAVALVWTARALSYGELNGAGRPSGAPPARAGSGCRRRVVGVCLERSAGAGGGIAGGAEGRRRLRAAGPRLSAGAAGADAGGLRSAWSVVSRADAGAAGCPARCRSCSDRGARPRSARPDRPRRAPATPENLAYVIYTSGSTGPPEGGGHLRTERGRRCWTGRAAAFGAGGACAGPGRDRRSASTCRSSSCSCR